MRRVVVKLGSSVVADGDGEPRLEVLAHVCDALAEVHGQGREAIVVTSGAIARGSLKVTVSWRVAISSISMS